MAVVCTAIARPTVFATGMAATPQGLLCDLASLLARVTAMAGITAIAGIAGMTAAAGSFVTRQILALSHLGGGGLFMVALTRRNGAFVHPGSSGLGTREQVSTQPNPLSGIEKRMEGNVPAKASSPHMLMEWLEMAVRLEAWAI